MFSDYSLTVGAQMGREGIPGLCIIDAAPNKFVSMKNIVND